MTLLRISAAVMVLAVGLCRPLSVGAAVCVGDCSADGEVTVDELIVGVNIALGSATVETCTPIDANQDRDVTIDEIVSAVNAALVGCPAVEPRLLALSREGAIASLDVAAPWTVRATADLKDTIASARCRAGRCLVVRPATDVISVVDSTTLSFADSIQLERKSDPRDVAFVDDHTVIVSQYGSADLLEIDIDHATRTAIDLTAVADEDGLPEALRMATCGRRIFVQLLRVDHDSGEASPLKSAIAVIDLDRSGSERVVDTDPQTPGTQAIVLAGKPNFDMPVDCRRGILHIAEPDLLMKGGGSYEQVDLATFTASELPIDTGAEVGGFEYVEQGVFWLITHTTTGPAPSSHLNIIGGATSETYNTFASEHVDDLALDRQEDLLFFPDPCNPDRFPTCHTGVQPFHAHTGERAVPQAIDVGFAPIEVVISR